MHRLWKIIVLLVIISPVGLILPYMFKAGSAWGEWSSEEIKELVGYIPAGLEKLSSLWNPILPDYNFKGWEERSILHQSIAYIVSGLIGVAIVSAVTILIGRLISRR
jgi:hypothetical protein